jgi:uncharacterized membrane protein
MWRFLAVLLALASGGWMAFDGSRALLLGDYVTPASGPYAGQLGPWAGVLEAVGLAPRSTLVKSSFVVYGLSLVAAAVAFAFRRAGSRRALLAILPLGLWYLPFGTVLNLAALFVLSHRSLK